MTTVVIEVKSRLEWAAKQTAPGHRWIAECEALGLSVEGKLLDKLHSLIDEACFALFKDLLEDNEQNQFLSERGWQATNMPDGPVEGGVAFSVSWNLVAQGAPGVVRVRLQETN